MLHGLPELHRRAQREADHEHARDDRRRGDRPEPVDDHRDRQREHGEVRPAARREAARADGAVPGADEAAPLDGGDRAVLGAVQPKGSAPHQPGDEHCRTREPDRQLERRREERQQRRGQDHRGEKNQALTAARDTGAPCQRPQRRRKLEQAAENRDPARPRRRRAHRPLVQLTVGRRERPVALADDDDAVRPGHPAEPRERRRGIGTREDLESGGVVHAHTVPHARPPGKCRAAQRGVLLDLVRCYQRPRPPTKPSSARTSTTIKMM